MSNLKTYKFTQTIQAPIEQVYDAFTSSVALQNWFCNFAEVDASKKGRFYAWWNVGYYTSGLFTKLKENKSIVFTWHGLGEPAATKVKLRFKDENGTSHITVKHVGFGSGEKWDKTINQITTGWETAFENLKSVLETGLDKRIFDQPMLGILPTELIDKDKAAERGLPVETGVVISDVVSGLGAEAAGLIGEDILYSINDQILKDYQDFGLATADKKAGDPVELIFYRENEKHTVAFELSGRPIPPTPQSADDIAEILKGIYKESDNEIDALFDGVTDEQASHRAGDDDWSAKEVLAHLIFSERYLHLAMTAGLENFRAGGFSNDLGMHAAIANAYPLEELITELKRCEAISVEAAAALPEYFVADKRRFIALSLTMGEQGFPLHTRSHFNQISAALEAAKGIE